MPSTQRRSVNAPWSQPTWLRRGCQDRAPRQCGPLLSPEHAISGIPEQSPLLPPVPSPEKLHKGEMWRRGRRFIPGTFHSSCSDQWGSQPRTEALGSLLPGAPTPSRAGASEPFSKILPRAFSPQWPLLEEINAEGFGWGWVAV